MIIKNKYGIIGEYYTNHIISMQSIFGYLHIDSVTYLDTRSGFEAAKTTLGLGDSTTLVNSMSSQMSELVEDAVAACCGDIVGHFGLIRNEL